MEAEVISQIPNDAAARDLMHKLDYINVLRLSESKGLLFKQVGITKSDTVTAATKKIVKAYVKHKFPSSTHVKTSTSLISATLVPTQATLLRIAYSLGEANSLSKTKLMHVKPVALALTNFIRIAGGIRHIVDFTLESVSPAINVYISGGAISERSGSVKDYVLGIFTGLDSLKEALDNLVLAIPDLPAAIQEGTRLKELDDAEEARKAKTLVEDTLTSLTGIVYGNSQVAPVEINIPEQVAVAPVVTRPDTRVAMATFDTTVTAATQAPIAPEPIVAPAPQSIQDRLNELMRQQGVV